MIYVSMSSGVQVLSRHKSIGGMVSAGAAGTGGGGAQVKHKSMGGMAGAGAGNGALSSSADSTLPLVPNKVGDGGAGVA